eukprot:TRINITY_DN8720_c0_g1_i1.p1 TRINITY_DN8720_c0_g1~~TRINITY_DN8720_c0_g1_i1.p1  ORF type:complete len:398 (+),score=97.10 TRINITY_DN8720_c0_g1_i1:68-1261(+)
MDEKGTEATTIGLNDEDLIETENANQTQDAFASLFASFTVQQKLEYARNNLSATDLETRTRVQRLIVSCFQPDNKDSPVGGGDERVLSSVVVDVLFQTLSLYDESKRSQNEVEKTISEIAQSNTDFITEFLKVLEKSTTIKPPSSLSSSYSTRALITLLRWTCALVSSNFPFFEALQSRLSSALSLQGALIEAVALSSNKTSLFRSASRSYRQYMRRSPTVVPHLINHFVVSQPTRGHPAVALIGSFCAKHQSDLFVAHKTKFLEGYVQSVLSATIKQDRGYLEWYRGTLKRVEKKEFGEILLPAISRLLKRTPEIAINGISYLLETLSSSSAFIDLNDFAVEISNNLIPQFKSVDESLRGSTLVAFSYLINNICKSPVGAAAALLQQFVSLIGMFF